MATKPVIEIYSSDEDHHEEERNTERQIIVLDEEEEEKEERAKPIGDAVRIIGTGTMKRKHYASFKLKDYVYKLQMTVLLNPGDEMERAYVAVIRDISEDTEGDLWVKAQWFYRPEDLPELDEHWEEREDRVLYYSFHCDEVPAESMINNCTVHFVPSHKKVPPNSELYGMVVQKVYDIVERKLFDITDGIFEGCEKHEIDMLIQTTRERTGELPDILTEDASVQQNDYSEGKKSIGKKVMDQINVSEVDPTTTFDQLAKTCTPGSSTIAEVSKFHAILSKYTSLTGTAPRDKWLEKLLDVTQHVCISEDALSGEDRHKKNVVSSQNSVVGTDGSYNDSSDICWEEEVITILSELERVTYEAMDNDFQKYNQKMRQLHFNLKNSTMLAKRLLKKELEPIALLTMTPEELKEGLIAEERITKEPEKPEQMRMTETRCSRCKEKQVSVIAAIQTGDKADHYQVEIRKTIPKGAISGKDFKTKKIFVGGIPKSVNEDEFKNFFAKFGEVEEHQIMRGHSGRSRGFGFIAFSTEKVVDDLLTKGNKIEFAGTQVEMKKAEPKKPGNAPPSVAPTKHFANPRPAYGRGYKEPYGAVDSGAYSYGSRPRNYPFGYAGSEFDGGYGGYASTGVGSYRGEASLEFPGGYGGGSLGRGFDFGGAGGGYRGASGYGSAFESGAGVGYGGAGGGYAGTGAGLYEPRRNYGGGPGGYAGTRAALYGPRRDYGGGPSGRYNRYAR